MSVLDDPRVPVAKSVLDSVFKTGGWNAPLSEKMPEIYDACLAADEDPVHRMGNAIWVDYSGGTTCHHTAQKIVDAWKRENLV